MKVKFLKNYNFYLNELPAKMYTMKQGDVMEIKDNDKVNKWIERGVAEIVSEVENKMIPDAPIEVKKEVKKTAKKK